MISKECKFLDFVGAVQNKNYFEIIHLADQEATAAERLQTARQARGRRGDLRRLQPGAAPATGSVTIPGGNPLLTRR
jgi:hypothetical protein